MLFTCIYYSFRRASLTFLLVTFKWQIFTCTIDFYSSNLRCIIDIDTDCV